MLAFRLLGPLEVRDAEGLLIAAPRRKQRALLALLLLRAGTVVSVDAIVDALWGSRPPASARANLHSYVSGVRHLLQRAAPTATPRPATAPNGYRLDLAPGECDADVFETLVAEGRSALAAGRHGEAVERLTRALGLWRGRVLEDLAPYDWLLPHVARLDEARTAAIEDQVDARLALGQHADVAVELAATTVAHPLRERLWGQYMLALGRTGGRTPALRAYERLRSTLAAELGVAPGPSIQDLYRRIRDGDDTPEPPPGDGPWSPPALLPPGVQDFTGREHELRRLRELLTCHAVTASSGLPVAGITGMAGIGKTTLAIKAAREMAPSYSDGQLYVNLRGAESSPADPTEVLGHFLRALGVHSRAVPSDPVERMGLYRTVVADRRVLVVLDNAAAEEQVRPLLPGAATCAVVITSRSPLPGLEGTRWLELDVLPADEATRLLARVVDDRRVADHPADAATIVRICGGLPLAVRVAGARLSARPRWTLARLVALLRDEHRRLDGLNAGDLEVRASLALSYDGLDTAAQRLFRLLGHFDVPDFAGWLAAAVLDGRPEPAAKSLETLVDRHLLVVARVDATGQLRYRFHDLVRIFARERARIEDRPHDRPEALERGFGTWLAIAERLAPALPGPCWAPIGGDAPRPPIEWLLDEVRDVDPLVWFDAERVTLLSAIRQACGTGHDEAAFDLAARMEKYFDIRGMYAEWERNNRLVMAACEESGNRRGEAVMLRGLIDVTTWITTDQGSEAMTRSYPDAKRLLAMFAELEMRDGMADAAVMCSWALTAMGRHAEAIEIATRALRWADESGHLGGQARAHVAMAVAHGESLRLEPALVHLYEALAAARALGNPRYEATVLQFLGIAHREGGQLDLSERFLDESLEISRRHRDTYTEVLTVLALGRLQLRRRDPRARSTAEAALAVAREYRMTHHIADSLGILGEIELAEGRPAEAAEYLRESVAAWRTRGWLTFQAAALSMLGRALTDFDPDAARDAFDEAHGLYLRLGDATKAGDVARLIGAV